MITCPWCGTHYAAFQSNCNNCGGPLPPPAVSTATNPYGRIVERPDLPAPPLPPRPISDRYAGRLMMSDGWVIGAGVFALLGGIFTCVGGGLTLGVVTAFVGVPFLGLGIIFLGLGIPILIWRYQEAMRVVNVLRHGQVARGEIIRLEENLTVRVNGRHPWVIYYQFQMGGRNHAGAVRTLTPPALHLQPGQAVYVLYLPDAPEQNVIYPHP